MTTTQKLNFRPRTAVKPVKQPSLNMRAFSQPGVKESFQNTVTQALGDENADDVPTDRLASTIRTSVISAARDVIPEKVKAKFPEEFSAVTIQLIHQKREQWKILQKSGRRVTRSLRDGYRKLCRDTKLAIKRDRNARLDKEATELTSAFNEDTFKGYSLLKQQHRTRSKAVLPPESDFTTHYRAHYQLDEEEPLEVHSCELPPLPADDTLTRDDFDAGVKKLNVNRQAGHDNCAPEYIKHDGPVLLQWLFTLMFRIWTFACELPAIDRIGCLLPIPKKAG